MCHSHLGLPPPAPDLRDLMNLRVSDWNRLGLALELDFYDLDIIEKDNQGDRKRQALKMFQLWLNSKPDASYEQLIKALREVGDEAVASSLCTKYGKFDVIYIGEYTCSFSPLNENYLLRNEPLICDFFYQIRYQTSTSCHKHWS